MKKLITITAGIIFGLVVALLFLQGADKAVGNVSSLNRVYMTTGGGSSTLTPVATTTAGVTYLAANATTTFPFSTEQTDIISLSINMTASTSVGRLVYTYEVSEDNLPCNTDPNRCSWFIPATATTTMVGSPAVTMLASTTPTFTWQPDGALNATSSLNVLVNPVAYRYVRIKANITGSAGALWMTATNKTQDNY